MAEIFGIMGILSIMTSMAEKEKQVYCCYCKKTVPVAFKFSTRQFEEVKSNMNILWIKKCSECNKTLVYYFK